MDDTDRMWANVVRMWAELLEASRQDLEALKAEEDKQARKHMADNEKKLRKAMEQWISLPGE